MTTNQDGEPDTLKTYWDHFFKAETGTYEKSTWLDLFLAEFLIRYNEGANPKELIKFCPVSGVVTLVGCELLCGIHRVTSSINTHYTVPLPCLDTVCSGKETPIFQQSPTPTPPESRTEESRVQPTSLFTIANSQSSTEILRKYLLGGIAWRCLILLRALGVEGLSCCRQLSSVLIWLYGELSGAPSPAQHRCLSPASTRTPIHQLFSHRIWSQQKPVGSQGSKVDSAASSEKGSVVGSRSRHGALIRADVAESKSKRKLPKNTDPSTEESDSNGDLQILNRSITIKVCTPDDGFDYFNTPVRSSTEYPIETLYSDPYSTPLKAKPKVDDYMTDKHKEILNTEITTLEFVLIIIDLLQELCKAESSLSGAEGSQISVQCINFSLRNLCSLQFGSAPAQSSEGVEEASETKVALTELLIVSLDKVLVHSDLCVKLINNGILPMLLRILEDVVCKSSSKYRKNDNHNRAKPIQTQNKTESENLLKFVFGISYSITAFFHCLLMQCRSVDKLREFTEQFKLYAECLKGGLLKDCIELMIRIPDVNQEETVTLINKLVETIGKLVCGMKRVRSEVIHSAACPRTRHKMCRKRLAAGMHHHHDILGEASIDLPMASACCISVLYGTLTAVVIDDEVSAEPTLRNKILKVMLNCGVCCCFSPGTLMESIVRLMLTHNNIASLCLQLLEHTVYGELGASVLIPKVTDQLPCSICEPCDNKRDLARKCSHGISPMERKSGWSFLIHYNSLLQLDNHNNVLHATVSHLLRVTPKCRTEMKYELLFSVVYPSFIVAKHRYILRLEESAYFLTVSCLNIFASLLNSISFAEQFIQKGGLSYVLELVSLSEFSNQCCSILEIAIIVEIFKLMRENSDVMYFREISTLASVQMLFKSLSDMTEKCYKIFRLKLTDELYEELSDLTKENEMLVFTPASTENVQTTNISVPQLNKSGFSSSDNIEESIEDYIEVLKNIWTFWKTCADLCLYSPMFREYVVCESVFVDSYGLLKLLLHYLCHCECGPAETRILIKIMEALLTVQFAVSDVTSGRSKETSCRLIRLALSGVEEAEGVRGDGEACAGGGGGGGGGLQAVCEALLRVAAARPSLRHTMPALTHAKVPPLSCASGGSSACGGGSSSEESAPAPYASDEHARLHAPDDGYEADVEISKLDMTSYKLKKLSESLSSIGSNYAGVQNTLESTVDCCEYTKNGELAHPELCMIVVDILIQLIQKLAGEAGGGDAGGAGGAGAAGARRAARAVCGRLCGRLARARRPPAGLLRRLLAPPVRALLVRTHPALEDLQRSILELIHSAASQSISPVELGELLKLLAAENPPLDLLLPALQRLAAAATPNSPDCILTFPVEVHPDNVQMAEDDMNLSANCQVEAHTRKLRESHIAAGVTSAWSRHAARGSAAGAGWAAWQAGFAALLWLRLQRPAPAPQPPRSPHTHTSAWDDVDEWQEEWSESESPVASVRAGEPLHVLSVGHDSLMFEMWLEPATGMVVFRVSRAEGGRGGGAVAEGRAGPVTSHRWHCIALNVTDRLIKRRLHVQVTMYVNGYEHETVSLPIQGILVRKATPSHVLLGHAGGATGGATYQVSGVHVYRGPLLTRARALHLAAHGPHHACQIRCETPNYSLLLTPELLDSDMDWDQMYEITHSSLRELHDGLLLTFSAQTPSVLNVYQQIVTLPTVFGSRVGACGAPPAAVGVVWAGAAPGSARGGLAPALLLLGGPQHLLYLFARVVELQGSAEQQAAALSVAVRAGGADGRLVSALLAPPALDMLLAVLAAPACRPSHHMLKVILDAACSAPLLIISGGVSISRGDAALIEPRLLVLLLRAWKHLDGPPDQEVQWEEEGRGPQRGSVWALTLRCVCALLRDDHPRREFNLYQMQRLGLLAHLLLVCKERYLNSACGAMCAGASASVVQAVRALLGTPPAPTHLAHLADFLLLMHQASDTFVTHSRANFYFLLTPETPEMSDFMNSAAIKKHRRSRRSENTPSNLMTSLDDLTSDNSESVFRDIENVDKLMEKESIGRKETTKQLKGIINKQIKERSKRKASSASENSDTTVERSDEGGGRTEVDAEDENKTTEAVSQDGDEKIIEQAVSQRDPDIDEKTSVETSPRSDGNDDEKSATHTVPISQNEKVEMKITLVKTVESDDKMAGEAVSGTGEEDGKIADSHADDKASGQGVGKSAEDELNEYIVVDVDEIQHTTVEMYTSGIYQQRRVRAGAGPGWAACEGLLLVLRDALLALTDHDFAQTAGGAVSAESLAVLANHRAAAVRAAVVRALAALQRRAPPALQRALLARHYYVHLANQISLYESSWELAAACASLITKCDVPLEDQLHEDIWADVGEGAVQYSPPLLALLPVSVHDPPLVEQIALLLHCVIDKASARSLSEVCAAEAIVRAVRAAARRGVSPALRSLHALLAHLARRLLAAHHAPQTIVDIHHMLTYVEMTADEDEAGTRVRVAARDAQISMFNAQLDYLEERLHSSYNTHTKYSNYFTTVLSTAVSRGAEGASRSERAELAARHASAVTRAVGFLVAPPPRAALPSPAHAALVHRLLATLLQAVSGTGASAPRPKWWVGSGAVGEWVSPLQELFWWAASGAPAVRPLQPALLRALYAAPPHVPRLLTPPDPSAMRKLAVYLLTMLQHMHAAAAAGAATVELAITDWARGWAVSTQAGLPARLPSDALLPEAAALLRHDRDRWARAAARQRPAVAKVVFGREGLSGAVTEAAMGLTRSAVEAQNAARKEFLDHLRRDLARRAAASQRWRRLVADLTHQQAVWHDPSSYPQSWQLDPTEGPGRVRVRLRRAHLRIHPRFLKPEHQHKAERSTRAAPLEAVVGGAAGARGAAARLQPHETLAHSTRAAHVTVARDNDGDLLLTDRCLHFVPDGEGEAHSWPLARVAGVATRRWCLQERAVELFLSSGHAHLLAFPAEPDRAAFLRALAACHLPARSEPDTLSEAMSQWRSGNITNWEYLMRLNGLGGRTYNDLMQYPVFPFVIADYTSRILDLNNPASFRDLTKPMGVQNKNREQHYINTYNDLCAARRTGCSALARAPHHYASLYSNSGGVLHYLVRLPPFTELFLNYQDNNFDMPDRTFHSLATTWRLITNDSPTDVKELIPELFYLPELYYNNEGLSLGVRQCGAGVDAVQLPAWAADARLFTLALRQALEAPLVTDALPHWIDLVFGYKQTGQPAIDAINVFPACTYYGFDPLALEDEVDRTAAEAMVRTYGQAPRQLLRHPHPHRAPDLHQREHHQPSVWAGVEGARWGRWCGSPGAPPPAVRARRSLSAAAAAAGAAGAAGGGGTAYALPHARTAAFSLATTALLTVQGDGGTAGGYAIVSCGHADHIVRLRRRRDAPYELLLQVPPLDQITCVATCADTQTAFVGHASGRVVALEPSGRARTLAAHAARVSALHVCLRAALLASADTDGRLVLWDLNQLTYIRTLPNRDMLPVTHVTVSETLCDVASVHDPARACRHVPAADVTSAAASDVTGADSYERDADKYQSLIRVHTVNGSFVGSVKVAELVTSVCYSNAYEGVSVNCVVAGLRGGGVLLYSSWDLRRVAVIPPAEHAPLISVTYSSDSQLLFGLYGSGVAVAWESAGEGGGAGAGGAAPRLLPAHALL